MKITETRFYADGTVRFWNVYEQRWCKWDVADVSDRILALMNDKFRERVAAILAAR